MLHIFILWKNGFTKYDLLILLNRILIINLYSNETQWKKLISFAKFNPNETKPIRRLSKNQLTQLFPPINITYEILIIRSIIIYYFIIRIYTGQ